MEAWFITDLNWRSVKKKKKKNELFHKKGWDKMRKNIYNIKSVLILYTKISVYIRTEYKRPKNKIFKR